MNSRAIAAFAVVIAVGAVVLAVFATMFAVPPAYLDSLYTPTFKTVQIPSFGAGLAAMAAHLQRTAGHDLMGHMVPDQAGALWLSLIVVLLVGINLESPLDPRNFDMLVAQAPAWMLFGLVDLLEEAKEPEYFAYMRLCFTGVALAILLLMVRSVMLAVRPYRTEWRPALRGHGLAALATVLVLLNLAVVFLRHPDDSSYFANLGAQRLLERNMLPYGDPILTGTPGAAYPPLMYIAEAATHTILGVPLNAVSPDRLGDAVREGYVAPADIITQVDLAFFQLIAVSALLWIGHKLRGPELGWALVALYCGSAYTVGVGGLHENLTGVTFVSHVMAPAATLVAFALLDRPAPAGLALAAAAGLGFYPAFFFPVWLGWMWARGRRAAAAFAGSFAASCAAMLVWIAFASHRAPGLGLIQTVVRDTLGHHTDPAGYGMSPFGLWGQQTGVMAWLSHPLVGSSAMLSPIFLAFVVFLAAATLMARRANLASLALLTATAAMGANLWKIHATGSYVAWFYPFLLIGILSLPWSIQAKSEAPPDAIRAA